MTVIRWVAGVATIVLLAGLAGTEGRAALPPAGPVGSVASVEAVQAPATVAARPDAPVRLAQADGKRAPSLRRGKLAPTVNSNRPGIIGRAQLGLIGLMVALGAETGLIGAAFLGIAAVAGLLGLWRLWRLVSSRFLETLVPGEVVASEPAPGGGYHPIIRYVDSTGKGRHFTAPLVTPGDPVGLRMRLRVDGPRPRIVGSPPSRASEALGLLLPFTIALLAGTVALTGRIAGLAQLAVL